jgi:hypothetical protein
MSLAPYFPIVTLLKTSGDKTCLQKISCAMMSILISNSLRLSRLGTNISAIPYFLHIIFEWLYLPCFLGYCDQGDQMIEKTHPNMGKSSQNSFQAQNCQNIYIKAQFESPNIYIKPLLNLKVPAINRLFRQKCKKVCLRKMLPTMFPFLWATSPFQKVITGIQM